MGCHICADEVAVFFALLAAWRPAVHWLKGTWAKRHKKPICCHQHEHEELP